MSQIEDVRVERDTERWEAEIKAVIPAELLAKYRESAIKEIQKSAKVDGFRAGHAPADRILEIYGEAAVMRSAAERAIQEELPTILAKESLPIVEAPRVTTDTPENGKPLTFTARAALAPEVVLGDYAVIAKKRAAERESTEVSDQEHLEALTHLRRERARIDKMEAGAEPAKAAEESKTLEEKDLPELDDMFVQSLGYESAAAFSEALRRNIKTEKELRASERVRAAILDDLVKDSKISYPASLREYELDDMEARLKDDLARIGQTIDAYLTETKKTREELRTEWKDAADKRAKVRLILAEIARKETIEPDQDALAHEVEHAKQHYPQANIENLRTHIAHAMRNEQVLRFLETGEKGPLPVAEHDHDHE